MGKSNFDQSKLKQKLLSGEIGWQEALAIITSFKSPPWKSKEWKAKRDALLANKCQQCGSMEKLTLQHTRHPKSIQALFQELRGDFLNEWNEWKIKHPIQIDLTTISADTNACPKCSSPTIRFRKTMNDWKCIASVNGIFCHHIFETPIHIISETVRKDLWKKDWYKMQEEFDTAFGIGKQVVVMAIDQHGHYLTMQDTVTLCKRCAFVADRTKMVFCEICKQNYHVVRYDRCSKCAGIDSSISGGLFFED